MIDIANHFIDYTSYLYNTFNWIIKSQEGILYAFEYSGGKHMHENRVHHSCEVLFYKTMMLIG